MLEMGLCKLYAALPGDSGGRLEKLRRKDAAPVHVTQLCFSPRRWQFFPGAAVDPSLQLFSALIDQPHFSSLQTYQHQASCHPCCGLNCMPSKIIGWASLVAQWLRICLPMQGTRVRPLVWEDPTCRGAPGPVSHNY